jgi:hypothetical protein
MVPARRLRVRLHGALDVGCRATRPVKPTRQGKNPRHAILAPHDSQSARGRTIPHTNALADNTLRTSYHQRATCPKRYWATQRRRWRARPQRFSEQPASSSADRRPQRICHAASSAMVNPRSARGFQRRQPPSRAGALGQLAALCEILVAQFGGPAHWSTRCHDLNVSCDRESCAPRDRRRVALMGFGDAAPRLGVGPPSPAIPSLDRESPSASFARSAP